MAPPYSLLKDLGGELQGVAVTLSIGRVPILLVSDFPIFRESLQANLEKTPDFEVVACAQDAADVVPLLKTHRPKLVLLDLSMPWDDLCRLLDEIHANGSVRSLVMSDTVENQQLLQAIQHGASGVVSRRTSPELFAKSIHTVLAGEFWVTRSLVAELVHLVRGGAAAAESEPVEATRSARSLSGPSTLRVFSNVTEGDAGRFGLTRRELQIIGALVDGQVNKDIANTFGISEYTVKHHLTNIYDKLGVYNRVELVLFAMNQGLFTTNDVLALQDSA